MITTGWAERYCRPRQDLRSVLAGGGGRGNRWYRRRRRRCRAFPRGTSVALGCSPCSTRRSRAGCCSSAPRPGTARRCCWPSGPRGGRTASPGCRSTTTTAPRRASGRRCSPRCAGVRVCPVQRGAPARAPLFGAGRLLLGLRAALDELAAPSTWSSTTCTSWRRGRRRCARSPRWCASVRGRCGSCSRRARTHPCRSRACVCRASCARSARGTWRSPPTRPPRC